MASYIPGKPLITAALTRLVVLSSIASSGHGQDPMAERYEKWMTEYGRTYKDEAEKARRFEVFKANAAFVDASNARAVASGKKYHLAINRFADMTHDEFMARYTGFKPTPAKMPGFKYENVSLSDDQQEVDWRQQGAVTAVKDQGKCNCCYAFSAVAAIEGRHQITTGELVSLSEQQLLDCSTDYGNHGCSDGSMVKAFMYIIGSNNGIASESAYSYTATQGTCQNVQPVVTISGYQRVPIGDEYALAVAVAGQPVSVAVNSNNFQFYGGGVMTADSCGTNLNHAVTAVGYGTAEDGTQYWLLKNQWGNTWGEQGYLRLQRGVGACGVAMDASYPIA